MMNTMVVMLRRFLKYLGGRLIFFDGAALFDGAERSEIMSTCQSYMLDTLFQTYNWIQK